MLRAFEGKGVGDESSHWIFNHGVDILDSLFSVQLFAKLKIFGLIFRTNQGIGITYLPVSSSSATPMNISVNVPGHLKVNHILNIGDVKASGGNISAHDDLIVSWFELV